MDVLLASIPGKSREEMEPMAIGLKKFFGKDINIDWIDAKLINNYKIPMEEKLPNLHSYDFACIWGVYTGWTLRNNGYKGNILSKENGFFKDRETCYHLGWNGLNNRADFCNQDSPPDRFNKLFKQEMIPYHSHLSSNIIVAGQIVIDKSVAIFRKHHGEDLSENFWNKLIEDVRNKFSLPVYFKRHPKSNMPIKNIIADDVISDSRPIKKYLKDTLCLVSICSNASVEALLNGVPVHNLDRGSMTWDMGTQGDVTENMEITYPNRDQWAYNLAYANWYNKEIETGEPFERLFGGKYAIR